MADPIPLEEKYRIAALALADLSEDDQPDSDLFHPWGGVDDSGRQAGTH